MASRKNQGAQDGISRPPHRPSHQYTIKGTNPVVLTVTHHADYSFGDQDWRPVDKTVTVPSAPFTVVAAKEPTGLVAEDWHANPHSPGC
ncbi:hypothetical protein [Cryobacterium sp. Y11]|uniref:hypothetical protein n=1 Tax=Cryobacterium sp. Y11 TaxID=2045016 RepID=UPI000CE2DDB3|nr:hypothetical protein [Cryobacterium sp. Y11]